MRRACSAQNRWRGVSTALLAIWIVPLILASCSSPNPGPSPDDATHDAQLTDAITQAWHTTSAPGVIVGVWTNGRTPYVHAFGTSDPTTNRPMATNLFMRVGSVTKTFTVTAVLQLVDNGEVALDDPIAKYIPDVPGGDKVTVRDLADMRSGLASYTKNDAWTAKWLANPSAPWTPQQRAPHAHVVSKWRGIPVTARAGQYEPDSQRCAGDDDRLGFQLGMGSRGDDLERPGHGNVGQGARDGGPPLQADSGCAADLPRLDEQGRVRRRHHHGQRLAGAHRVHSWLSNVGLL